MMMSEPRKEDPNMNMMLKSGVAIGKDKGKLTEVGLGVCKTPAKQHDFNLRHTKRTFMEAKKSFTEVSISGSEDQPELEMNPSMLTTFLETCMKMLRYN